MIITIYTSSKYIMTLYTEQPTKELNDNEHYFSDPIDITNNIHKINKIIAPLIHVDEKLSKNILSKFRIADNKENKYIVFQRKHEELQYLELLKECLFHTPLRDTRNGKTASVFGRSMTFNLYGNRLPVLTTKKMFTRGVIEELLFFIKGKQDTKELEDKNIKIWTGNTADTNGDMGPMYGVQWRKWMGHDGKTHDQLNDVIEQIRNNPTSRRMVVSAWNVSQLSEGVLYPCHIMFQFHIDMVNKRLNMSMYQRSADIGLGMPFNIMSYALLCHIIAQHTGYEAGEFTYFIGDAHVYENHFKALKKQVDRKPYEFPTVKIDKFEKLEDIEKNMINIEEYDHHSGIKMEMNV